MKRKLWSCAVSLALLFSLSGCDQEPSPELPEEQKHVVLLCEPIAGDPFLTSLTEPLEDLLGEAQPAADYTVVECDSAEEMEQAALAKVEEGCDLLMMVGEQYAETMSHVAEQYPEGTFYVMLDGICEDENVGSYVFRTEELAYLTGIVAASVGTSEEHPHGPLGSIHAFQDQNSFAWRWGYMEGARSVNPELLMDDFHFVYTKSYDDEAAAKDAAISLADKGCLFINSCVTSADRGVFRASNSRGFFVSSMESKLTGDHDQPHLLLRQIKLGDVLMRRVLEDFLDDDLTLKTRDLGLKEDALNLFFIEEDLNTAPEDMVLTPEILTKVQAAAGQIKSGKLKLSVPLEEDYSF